MCKNKRERGGLWFGRRRSHQGRGTQWQKRREMRFTAKNIAEAEFLRRYSRQDVVAERVQTAATYRVTRQLVQNLPLTLM